MTDNEHGFLFEVGNLHSCSHALIDFVNSDNEILKEKGKKLKKHILKKYNDSLETEKYIKWLYDSIDGVAPSDAVNFLINNPCKIRDNRCIFVLLSYFWD